MPVEEVSSPMDTTQHGPSYDASRAEKSYFLFLLNHVSGLTIIITHVRPALLTSLAEFVQFGNPQKVSHVLSPLRTASDWLGAFAYLA